MPDAMEKNLAKFNRLLSLMDEDTLTKEDFLKAFEGVVKLVKQIEAKHIKAIDDLEDTYKRLEKKIGDNSDQSLTKIKADFERELAKLIAMNDKLTGALVDRMAQLKDGEPGKDADEEKIVEAVKNQIRIPDIMEIEKDLPKLGPEIRNALELLQGEERLDKDAIDGLDEELKRLEAKIATKGGGTVGQPNNAVQYADLTSQCNGVTKSFEVPRHRKVVALQSTQFPIIYRPVTDFTTANKTLTLTAEVSAPETNQTLIFLYIK
jgi:hypothetical protein